MLRIGESSPHGRSGADRARESQILESVQKVLPHYVFSFGGRDEMVFPHAELFSGSPTERESRVFEERKRFPCHAARLVPRTGSTFYLGGFLFSLSTLGN